MPSITEILETMDYGPAPEAKLIVDDWLKSHEKGFSHFINGEFVPAASHFAVMNPATGQHLAQAGQGRAEDIDKAVKAARAAFPSWSDRPGAERARYLYALARLVQKRERFLAVLETMDNGKPIRESRDIDVPLVARHFYYHAGWASCLADELPGYGPLGVCGQIIPWNFPLLMLAWKIAPALACGNTVVLKPAEYTPLTALAFAEICREAGLPPGVVNIVTGDGETGAALVAHEDIDKIAFTGSTEVGRIIRRATAGSGKKLSLELGGKSPFIVHEDADLDAAVEGVVDAVWFNQGQVCCASSRLLVQEAVAPRFLSKLKARLSKMVVGDPLDKSVDMGPVVDAAQLARIQALLAKGIAEGGTLTALEAPLPAQGHYIAPCFFTGVESASTVMMEEIFGPVAAVTTFRTPDEAAQLANHTRYGLAASIWSENLNLALDTAARMKAGVVWINSTNLFDAAAGFGGYHESGFGREGGREGLFEYLKPLWETKLKVADVAKTMTLSALPVAEQMEQPAIDRTIKLYIGGKQSRPDSGYSYAVLDSKGRSLALAGLGNRKDIRNAVEAALKASSWSATNAHARAQIIYYLAENMAVRSAELQRLLQSLGHQATLARKEVDLSLQRLFTYAGWADKYDGRVHAAKSRHVTLAMNEPYGVMGLVCPDEAPLLSLVSLLAPALAMGNRVVMVPSPQAALVAADLYQLIDTSDVPAGVVSIVTGERDELAKCLAEHDAVDALWYFGSKAGSTMVEQASAGNLKPVWCSNGKLRDWTSREQGQGPEFLRQAVQIKNIWVPYGE